MLGHAPLGKWGLTEDPFDPTPVDVYIAGNQGVGLVSELIGYLGLAVNVDPVNATGAVSDSFTFQLGAGGFVDTVYAQGVAEVIDTFIQLFVSADIEGVSAAGYTSSITVDAQIRSVQVNIDSVFANTFANTPFVAATDWIPTTDESDAEWEDSSPRCDQ